MIESCPLPSYAEAMREDPTNGATSILKSIETYQNKINPGLRFDGWNLLVSGLIQNYWSCYMISHTWREKNSSK